MSIETKVYVNSDLDVVIARVQARDSARKMGFSTTDQARFSLAASELAKVLSWNKNKTGEMVISDTFRNKCQGLQVVCSIRSDIVSNCEKTNGAGPKTAPYSNFVGACRLVDESSMDIQDDQQTRVTLIKWLKR